MDARRPLTRDDRCRALERARILLIVGEASCAGPWDVAVARALSSGAIGVVQLREKSIDDATFLVRARRLRELARGCGALLIVNDRARLVEATESDGVHVGEDDVPVVQARRLVGHDRLVGASTHDRGEIAAAAASGADYVGLGPCFPSTTKALVRAPKGHDLVRASVAGASVPVFAIGGITVENVGSLVAAGATRVAVGAGILSSADPAAAARAIRDALPV